MIVLFKKKVVQKNSTVFIGQPSVYFTILKIKK